jgi:CRISPR/Cas system CSM-associated protein Csm2 small subunit
MRNKLKLNTHRTGINYSLEMHLKALIAIRDFYQYSSQISARGGDNKEMNAIAKDALKLVRRFCAYCVRRGVITPIKEGADKEIEKMMR